MMDKKQDSLVPITQPVQYWLGSCPTLLSAGEQLIIAHLAGISATLDKILKEQRAKKTVPRSMAKRKP